jgi:DNA replication protein DnaC
MNIQHVNNNDYNNRKRISMLLIREHHQAKLALEQCVKQQLLNQQQLHNQQQFLNMISVFPTLPSNLINELFHCVSNEFHLNDDQSAVLKQVSYWFLTSNDETNKKQSDIILVNGVFGAGKSHLLAAICVFVSRVAKQREKEFLSL